MPPIPHRVHSALFAKGKIERPFRYVRANFFMARRFANLEDLNRQLRVWLDTVANARQHGSTGRVVAQHIPEAVSKTQLTLPTN